MPIARWNQLVQADHVPHPLSETIVESWTRCRAAGLDRVLHADHFRSVAPEDLAGRLARNAELLDVARTHLEWLRAELATVPHVVYLVDADGIVLTSTGDPDLMAIAHLAPGADWSEATMGTNGAGTAIAAGRPVAVVGPEHFDRRWHDCTCTAAPLRGADGSVIGAVDVTTSVADARPEQLVVVAHVAHAVSESLALRGRVRAAETAATLGRLASFMAHEIASPLDALVGTLEAFAEGAPNALSLLDHALQLAQRMALTVSDLRLLGGDGRQARQPVGIRALLDEAHGTVPATHHAEIAIAPALDGGEVLGHERLLSSALRNLVANAVVATPNGGSVGVRADADAAGVRISVWDSGIGIPAPERQRLFHEAITTKPEGSGIGLLLVRAIVEQLHDGRVAYAPRTPQGSEFSITLPVRRAS